MVADALEERAVALALEEGAPGFTVISAHGLGFPEHMTFFGLTYRGLEKVLLCVLDHETAETIANRLNIELELLSPFQGLAFCIDLAEAEGLDVDAIHRYVASRAIAAGSDGDDDT
ncbi:MAG: hypothetical protein WD928_07025 [Gammaproteobacteria bacterium]